MNDYIKRSDATSLLVSRLQETAQNNAGYQCDAGEVYADAADRLRLAWINDIPAADVRPVSEIEKIIESLQEQADIYNARAKDLLVEEDGQVSQYTWAVSLRETYRRVIKTLDDLIS